MGDLNQQLFFTANELWNRIPLGQIREVEKGVAELSKLLEELLKNGFVLDDEMALFIKSQVTIAGILTTLDPTLSQDKLVQKKASGLVKKEMPKRLLLFPAWTHRGYRSMLSNADVGSEVF